GAMSEAEIGQPGRVIGANRNIAGQIAHPVVDARIPFEHALREEVAKAGSPVAQAAGQCIAVRSGQGLRDRGSGTSSDAEQAQGCLSAENRCLENVRRTKSGKVCATFDTGNDLPRKRKALACVCSDGGMNVESREGPARLRWYSGE